MKLIPNCVLLLGLICGVTRASDDYFKFRTQSNGQPIEARVIHFDFQLQQVSLVDRSGTELKLSVADLPDPDKRLIVKALERQLFPKKGRKEEAESSGDGKQLPAQGTIQNPSFRRAPNWLADFESASKIAIGTDAQDDDRPILWFRVLGDLRGLM